MQFCHEELKNYMKSFWNYLDLATNIGIILIIIIYGLMDNLLEEVQIIFYSLVAIFMWINLLYYARCYQNLGKLVRMLLQVSVDIQAFSLIMIIVILGFSHANYICRLWPKQSEEFDSDFEATSVMDLFGKVFL